MVSASKPSTTDLLDLGLKTEEWRIGGHLKSRRRQVHWIDVENLDNFTLSDRSSSSCKSILVFFETPIIELWLVENLSLLECVYLISVVVREG